MSPEDSRRFLRRIREGFYTPATRGTGRKGAHGSGGGAPTAKWTFIQGNSGGNQVASTNIVCSLPTTTSSFSILIVSVASWEPSGGAVAVTVTDDKINMYNQIRGYHRSGDMNLSNWICNAPISGTQVVTATPGSASSMAICVMELGKTNRNASASYFNDSFSASSGTLVNPGNLSVSTHANLVFSSFVTTGVTLTSITAHSGQTLLAAILGNSNECNFGLSYILNPTSTIQPTFTINASTTWVASANNMQLM